LVSISNSGANVASNYIVTYVNNTTSTITPAVLTITADAQTKMYGTNDPTLSYVLSGLAVTDTAASVITGGTLTRANINTLAGEQVGSYAITQGSLATNPNYAVTFIPANLTITPRAIWTGPGAWPGPGPAPETLVVSAVNNGKVYGSNDPTLAYNVTGLVSVTLANGVVINDSAADVFAATNVLRTGMISSGVASGIGSQQVGDYRINQGTLAVFNNNYGTSFIFNSGVFTITPKVVGISVVADNKTKMYATNDPALTYTAAMTSGALVNGPVDGVQITDTFATVISGQLSRNLVNTLAGEQVGSYTITQGSIGGSGNYSGFTYTPAVLSITPRRAWNPAVDGPWTGPGPAPLPLTVTAVPATKMFGAADPVFAYTVTGLVSVTLANGVVIADTLANTFTGALLRVAGENSGGIYAITQGSLLQNANYASMAFVPADLTIGLAPQTINNMAAIVNKIAAEVVPEKPQDMIKKGDVLYLRDNDDLTHYMQIIELPPSGAVKFPVPDHIVQMLIDLSGNELTHYRLLRLSNDESIVATLENGTVLPDGVQFNAATRTFVVPNLSEVTLPLSVKLTMLRQGKKVSEKIMVLTK
jgi:hypothetical protein